MYFDLIERSQWVALNVVEQRNKMKSLNEYTNTKKKNGKKAVRE